VPVFADLCFFDVATADGKLERVGWAHADPAKQGLLDEMGRFVLPVEFENHPIARALRTREPVFEPEVTDAWLQVAATSPRDLQVMRDLDFHSIMTVPLIAAERKVGALTLCYTAESGRHHTRAELALVEAVAHRAALTVENARLYHELQAADRRKDEFMAMLAHELRNPLAPIHNAVQLLQRLGPDEPRLVRTLEIIERQVIQQSRLLDDLLDVSRISRGTILLRPERLDLVRLVRNAAEDSRSALEEAGLTLTLELPEEPVWVEGDPTRLAQVMSNLLQNAAKFTDRGGSVGVGCNVWAGTREAGDGSEWSDPTPHTLHPTLSAVITVRDTGIGIEPALLPHVFEAFTQADRSLDRSRGGLGLGLAMVKGLVEEHGGEVRVESAGLGHGTEFTLRLPLATAPAAVEESAPPAAVPSGPRRVLVVEDSRPAAEILRNLLESSGHTVEVAYSGPDAVPAAQQFQPDVVLCDLGLPGMDGYQVAAALRQNSATARVRLIALSGYGQEEDLGRSADAGFNLHLTKPVDYAELERLLGEGAETRQAEPPAPA
jgi:signal transduction histidine kinase/ActR/RegA family two-component response regulator